MYTKRNVICFTMLPAVLPKLLSSPISTRSQRPGLDHWGWLDWLHTESWLQDPCADEDVKRQSAARMTVWLTRMRPKSEVARTTGKLRHQFSPSRSAVIGRYILATAEVLTLPSQQKLILWCYLFQYLLIQKVFKQKVNTHTFLFLYLPFASNWEILNSVN